MGWASQPHKAHAPGISGKGKNPKIVKGEPNSEGVLIGQGVEEESSTSSWLGRTQGGNPGAPAPSPSLLYILEGREAQTPEAMVQPSLPVTLQFSPLADFDGA